MKKILFKITLAGMLAILSFSCSKKIDEAYANPNVDVRVPPEKLLPQILSAMWGNYGGHGAGNDARYIGQYVQNWVWSGINSNYDRMGYTNSAADISQSTWRMHYYDIGQNNARMITWAAEEGKWDYVGVGQAIFAWSWLTLTDFYGDAILDEAFNTSLLTFKYNTQEEVYAHVRNLCFEALVNLEKTGDAVGKLNEGDAYFYNGDVNKWKNFVYGILARYHNHLSNKASYKADSVIYYCDKWINGNADNAMLSFAATGISATNNFFGPFRNNFTSASNGIVNPVAVRQSAFIANLMTGSNSSFIGVNDPRAFYMLRTNTNGAIKGVEPIKGQMIIAADDRPENFSAASQSGTAINNGVGLDANCRYIFRNASPIPILTASEIKFMKAEAAYRKGDKQTAYNAYKDGIRLHFDLLIDKYNVNIPPTNVITTAIRDAYLNNTNVVPALAADITLAKIMLQKYIALWGHGVLETWTDMRRFHYTDADPVGGTGTVYTNFTPPSGTDLFTPDNGGKLVYRVRPRFNSEYVWNVNELARIGADKLNYHTIECWFSLP
jgi:hypothetical protein